MKKEEFMPEFDAGIESMDQDSKDAIDKSVRTAQLIHELKTTSMQVLHKGEWYSLSFTEAIDTTICVHVFKNEEKLPLVGTTFSLSTPIGEIIEWAKIKINQLTK